MIRSLQHFAVNPDYGAGIYRRRLRFAAGQNGILAQLDDTHHAAWLSVTHDGELVTKVDAGFTRAPADTCPGAIDGLTRLEGTPLPRMAEALRGLPMAANCTHLVDLANWAVQHRDAEPTTYDIEIPDQADTPVWISIMRNGVTAHRWLVADSAIALPQPLNGKPLMRGFTAWARDCFEGVSLMAAIMLQRGVFVARGRRYLVDRTPAIPLSASEGMGGACWSYSGSQLETGRHSVGYVRDFTSGVETATTPAHLGHSTGSAS